MNQSYRADNGGWRWMTLGVLLAATAAACGWMLSGSPRRLDTPPEAPTVQPDPAETTALLRAERLRFYDQEVTPLLDANQQANRQAVQRCLQRIDDLFAGYERGAKKLSEDLTSFTTRWGVLRRMPGAWWTEDQRIHEFIHRKFEEHVFGEEQLNHDLQEVLQQLRTDLRANGAGLLASVQAAVSLSDLPDLTIPSYKSYDEQIRSSMVTFAASRASDSVYHGVTTLIISEVAAVAASQLAVRALATLGGSAATSAAAAGGGAATGAAAGAGGGSLGGPVGAVIGFGVGLVAGVAIDWWMTDRFRSQLETDLGRYLKQLRKGIVEGAGARPGLKQALDDVVQDMHQAQTRVLLGAVAGETT